MSDILEELDALEHWLYAEQDDIPRRMIVERAIDHIKEQGSKLDKAIEDRKLEAQAGMIARTEADRLQSRLGDAQNLLNVRERLLRRFIDYAGRNQDRESGLLFEDDVRRHLDATKGRRFADRTDVTSD